MASTLKQIQEIAYYIKEENLRGRERIPTSEVIIKKFASQYEKTPEEIFKYLEQLKETHFIFSFTVVVEDPALFVQPVYAYVFSDQTIVGDLKHISEMKLASMYENMFYKKKSGMQAAKDLMQRIKDFNNTDIGRVIYEVNYLNEYHRIIQTNAFEYTESWKKEKLLKLYRAEAEASNNQNSAMDLLGKSDTGTKKEMINSKWGRAVHQFSVKFLIRIHFRKYEFDVVRKLLMTSKITELDDFIYIRNTVKELEKMNNGDPILKYHSDKLLELRRIAQAKINIFRKNQTMSSTIATF
jgi:hypothetical protein